MKSLNSKLLQEFLKEAGQKLSGEWILIGGTLLPAVGLDIRSTVDIALVGLGKEEASQTLELMEVAEALGLPIESINQAAAFFLNKIKYTPNDLIPLYKGKRATIYRPSLPLYWKLKISRLSETDLIDCQHYFHFCTKEKFDRKSLRTALTKVLKTEFEESKRKRLETLLSLLDGE